MKIDCTFASDRYRLERCDELPQNPPVLQLYYPGATEAGGRSGVWLLVEPQDGPTWVGIFETRSFGIDFVACLPDLERLLVIAGGQGYVVNANQPTDWAEVPIWPVLDARVIPEHGLIVLSTYDRAAAYDRSGLAWQTQRVAWDDLTLGHVEGNLIHASSYDPLDENNPTGTVVIDLRDGAHTITSGSEPPTEALSQVRLTGSSVVNRVLRWWRSLRGR